MAKYRKNTGAKHIIVLADQGQLQRQPDEMEKAHNAWIAYCKLAPSQRTIAAAHREIVEQASEDREFSETPVSIAKRARLSERGHKAGKRFICPFAHG